MITKLIKHIKPIVWTLLTGYLFLTPPSGLPKVHMPIPNFDKVIHFGLFLIFGLIIFDNVNTLKTKNIPKAWIFFGIVYGGSIELAQCFLINGRSGSIADWLADIAGIITGCIIWHFLPPKIQKHLV